MRARHPLKICANNSVNNELYQFYHKITKLRSEIASDQKITVTAHH